MEEKFSNMDLFSTKLPVSQIRNNIQYINSICENPIEVRRMKLIVLKNYLNDFFPRYSYPNDSDYKDFLYVFSYLVLFPSLKLKLIFDGIRIEEKEYDFYVDLDLNEDEIFHIQLRYRDDLYVISMVINEFNDYIEYININGSMYPEISQYIDDLYEQYNLSTPEEISELIYEIKPETDLSHITSMILEY